jgi:hypothetical protein
MNKEFISPKTGAVLRIKREEPGISLRQLGRRVGLSGEWVRQILLHHQINTAIPIEQRCYRCMYCRRAYRYGRVPHVYSRHFCSAECRYEWFYVRLICEGCGLVFRAIPSGRVALNGTKPSARVFCCRGCRSDFFKKR